jgi:hypothetical protein
MRRSCISAVISRAVASTSSCEQLYVPWAGHAHAAACQHQEASTCLTCHFRNHVQPDLRYCYFTSLDVRLHRPGLLMKCNARPTPSPKHCHAFAGIQCRLGSRLACHVVPRHLPCYIPALLPMAGCPAGWTLPRGSRCSSQAAARMEWPCCSILVVCPW